MKPLSIITLLAALGAGAPLLQQALVKSNASSTPAVAAATPASTAAGSSTGDARQANQEIVAAPGQEIVAVAGGSTYYIDVWGHRHETFVSKTTILDDPFHRHGLEGRDHFDRNHAAYDNPLNHAATSRSGAQGVQRSGTTGGYQGGAVQHNNAAAAAHPVVRETIVR